jgi:S-formylglutathione hydrolase
VFKSLSVLAPVSAPSQAGTGTKVFKAYLGDNPQDWLKHDACHLISQQKPAFDTILVSQGLEDNFLKAGNLRIDLLVAACKQAGQELIYEEHAGYDHGYYFVQSMMEQHVRFHEGYR